MNFPLIMCYILVHVLRTYRFHLCDYISDVAVILTPRMRRSYISDCQLYSRLRPRDSLNAFLKTGTDRELVRTYKIIENMRILQI
jgi:hypothetical protein